LSRGSGRVLIIVQNLPVPLDRRVWLECQALRARGYGVSVICPKGPGDPARQEIDGVRIYKYPPPRAARGIGGYALEFGYCWIVSALLSVVVAVRDGFSAIQACNPPDTYFLLGRIWKLFGKRFVYDQHDLNPEVFLSRFGRPRGVSSRVQLRILKALERQTYRTADRVISTNESYRRIALSRGACRPDLVTVVRSGPDTTRMRPEEPNPSLRRHTYLAAYLGIMGPQDGVDTTLRALDRLIRVHGRTDCGLALLGFGDCLEELKQLSADLGLDDYVTFTGRVGPREIAEYLSTADIGLCPDPKSPLNDVSTMNKTMEYMAYALPVLTFDLTETRVSAGDSARYVAPDDLDGFARAWDELLRDDDERVRLGRLGRERVVRELDWAPQAERYVHVWEDLLGPPPAAEHVTSAPETHVTARNIDRAPIDFDDPALSADYIRRRGRPVDQRYP
jgi:glycosyltransferase involved in cell wall biosynthesis